MLCKFSSRCLLKSDRIQLGWSNPILLLSMKYFQTTHEIYTYYSLSNEVKYDIHNPTF